MPESLIKVNKFTGLNNRDAAGRIQDTELVECQNFDTGRTGELIKRTGIKFLGTVLAGQPVTVLGFFQTATVSQIIIKAGNSLYYTTDGTTYTLIGVYNNVEWGTQYTNKFYMVRNNDVLVVWDGAAATTVAGSPSGTWCQVYKDRLFVINSLSATNPSRIYYSAVADFTTAGWSSLGTFVDINPGDGDILIAGAVLHDNFVLFKQYSTWILYVTPDPTQWAVRNASPKIGCVSKYTPREIEGFLFFVGARGAYKTDGYFFQEISEPVQPIFAQQSAQITINKTVAAWWEDKYIILLQTYGNPITWGSQAGNSWGSMGSTPWDFNNSVYTWLVYHTRTDSWTHWLPTVSEAISAFNLVEVQGAVSVRGLYIGSRANDGKLYRFGDPIYLDGVGTPYTCSVETKDFDFGEPEFAKRAKWLSVELQGAGAANITNIPDESAQAPVTLTFPDVNRNALRVPGSGFLRTWRARADITHDGPLTFYGFVLALSPRKKTLAGK